MNIIINGREIGQDKPPYIIAELSGNHNGKIDRALKSIDAAHAAGAEAIKLQTYTPETMTLDCDQPDFLISGGLWDGYKLYDLYEWAHTPYEWHQELFEHAKKKNITIFSSPFDETAVDLLEELETPAYKIASFELTDLPLISYVAKTGKPMIMSTGMANELEIEEAVETARNSGSKNIVLLHCISSYPAPIEQSNLEQIRELAKRFGVICGLSDHTLGTTASVGAVALGANVIEKHFTLSRKDKGPDSEFSIEPKELKQLVTDTKNVWLALGEPSYSLREAEKGNIIFRRSIYFVRDLPAGSVLSKNDIRRIRPGYGLPPKYFDSIVGKKLTQAVERGMPTRFEYFE
jgi:pseudaminic acid synthase